MFLADRCHTPSRFRGDHCIMFDAIHWLGAQRKLVYCRGRELIDRFKRRKHVER